MLSIINIKTCFQMTELFQGGAELKKKKKWFFHICLGIQENVFIYMIKNTRLKIMPSSCPGEVNFLAGQAGCKEN